MLDLRGKTALLTGASRGLGVHMAHALADRGMNLVLAARSAGPLEEVRAALEAKGVKAIAVPTDVGDRVALEALVAAARQAFGGVDLLVNNAGVENMLDYAITPLSEIESTIHVNLTSPMLLARMCMPAMIERGWGHIVNVASVAGVSGTPYGVTYSASKHGLVGFNRALRLTIEGEGYPIGATALCPGFVLEAGMYEAMRTGANIEMPAVLGTSRPADVIKGMMDGIDRNLPEVVVNSRPVRIWVALTTMFPSLSSALARSTGSIGTLKQLADRRRRELAAGS